MANQDLTVILEEYKQTTSEIINLLRDKFQGIKNYQLTLNVNKTIGSSASIVGGAITIGSLLIAPFTGGSSAFAALNIGSILGVTGGFLRIGANVYDIFASKSFQHEIKNIVEKRNEIAKKLHEFFVNFQDQISELEKNGYSHETSLEISLGRIFNRRMKALESYSNGGKFWKEISAFSKFFQKRLLRIGVELGKKTSMNVVKDASDMFHSVFAVWDISDLIDTWTNNHPTENKVMELIRCFKKDLHIIREFIECIDLCINSLELNV